MTTAFLAFFIYESSMFVMLGYTAGKDATRSVEPAEDIRNSGENTRLMTRVAGPVSMSSFFIREKNRAGAWEPKFKFSR